MFRHPTSTPSRPSGQDSGSLKPPKAPDRPLVPYMRFSRKMWAKVRSEHPDSQLWDIGKVIGQMWRDAPESEKAVYQQEYEIEKTEYEKALKTYHNSTAYQQYLSAKNRAKVTDKSNTVGGVIASSRGRLDTGGVVIQPVEDDEPSDLTSKRVAAVRFDRNHRLVAELFNGCVVTDTRTVVAQSRIDMLQKQAHSLALHQTKLEEELKKLNDVFHEKKRQMESSSEEFASRLKKVCEDKPQIDEVKYAAMVDEWSSKMLRAYEDYKAKQEALRAKQLVEREQLVEETPILYSLTVSDTSPSPKRKEQLEDASPALSNQQQQQQQQQQAAALTNVNANANETNAKEAEQQPNDPSVEATTAVTEESVQDPEKPAGTDNGVEVEQQQQQQQKMEIDEEEPATPVEQKELAESSQEQHTTSPAKPPPPPASIKEIKEEAKDPKDPNPSEPAVMEPPPSPPPPPPLVGTVDEKPVPVPVPVPVPAPAKEVTTPPPEAEAEAEAEASERPEPLKEVKEETPSEETKTTTETTVQEVASSETAEPPIQEQQIAPTEETASPEKTTVKKEEQAEQEDKQEQEEQKQEVTTVSSEQEAPPEELLKKNTPEEPEEAVAVAVAVPSQETETKPEPAELSVNRLEASESAAEE